MKIAIVGVGLIGGSLGMAVHRKRLASSVIGVGRNPAPLAKALALGAVDAVTTDFEEGVRDADLIVLCTPIPKILSDLERLPALVRPETILTDVGSAKAEIAAAGDRAFPGGTFIPGHPMAGSERSGVEAARHDLFMEAVWAFTPTATTDPTALNRVRHLAQEVGARTITLAPDAHDRAVAVTSHLPHVLAYALAALATDQAKRNPQLLDLAAGSFASATRVAASSPEMWLDIVMTNRTAVLESLQAYRADLDAVADALERGDADTLLTLFQRGYTARTGNPAG